jgi:hypothetical protein
MTPITVTQTNTGQTAAVAVDNFTNPFNIGLITTITGSPTYNIEVTPQDPMDATPTVWVPPTALTGLTAATALSLSIPCRALRINVTAGTGSVTLYIVQAGLR